MTNDELLAKATCFELVTYDPHDVSAVGRIRELKIELRSRLIDPNQSWAIVCQGECLNHKGQWEWESSPSSRTDEFLKRCRWKSRDEAIQFAQAHMTKYPLGYKPEKVRKKKETVEDGLAGAKAILKMIIES